MKRGSEHIQATNSRVVALLAQERKKQKISLNKLAAKAGVTQTALSYVEKGERKPTLHFLLLVSEALSVELWRLLRQAGK